MVVYNYFYSYLFNNENIFSYYGNIRIFVILYNIYMYHSCYIINY